MRLTSMASFGLVAICTNVGLAMPTNVTVSGLETRQKANIAQSALKFIDSILEGIKKDNEKRAQYTKSTVEELYKQTPQFNYVICHVKHDKRFDGIEGVDWAHDHREIDIAIGGTIGYELYAFRSGEFWRKGDGGWINWAYIGKLIEEPEDKKHLVFGNPAA